MRKTSVYLMLLIALPAMAQSIDDYVQQQKAQLDNVKKSYNEAYDRYKGSIQAEYDAYRKRANEQFAEFMRQKWEKYPVHEAEKPVEEKPIVPVIYKEPEPIPREDIKPITAPKPTIDVKPVPIAVKPKVIVVPTPPPTPEPIAPIVPKQEPYKKVSVNYFGTVMTLGFPTNDNFKIKALEENAIADAWTLLSDKQYDITIKTALDARDKNSLCDWAYLRMLQAVTEKQYGKTNEAVLAQAYLMTQSGYRIRLGKDEQKLYMLVASTDYMFDMRYYMLDGLRFYVTNEEHNSQLSILSAKFDKEQSLTLQIDNLPAFTFEPTPKRVLSSRKGVSCSVSMNRNLIDFFNTYPRFYFNGDCNTHWATYANTPMEQAVKDILYPSLKKAISGMSERDAVGILLNWVQTAFQYGYDSEIWGRDRAFFAQETLYYPYSDCEDRAILFSRIVRDLVGLDVVLLIYPEHLATAVAFNEEVKGDYLKYQNRKYIVCDPTYINAPIGDTMPQMNNQEAQIIALQ